jgi:hypothetical protein
MSYIMNIRHYITLLIYIARYIAEWSSNIRSEPDELLYLAGCVPFFQNVTLYTL